MFAPQLDRHLFSAVLRHLHISPAAPDLRFLDRLLGAYVRTVPWESALRIVKRACTAELADCPRWPEEFWQDHLQLGGGGTCFESNYAFSSLLHALGFEGYLTINDMGDSIGCHTAIIVLIQGQKWLVDAGFPIYAPLPVSANGVMHRATPFYHYTIRPQSPGRYQIERQPHPNWVAFTLIDRPVTIEQYRQATTADYGPDGHFLDRVIIHKILNEQAWRFNAGEEPPQFTHFDFGRRLDHPITADIATAIATKFCLDKETVCRALQLTVPNTVLDN